MIVQTCVAAGCCMTMPGPKLSVILLVKVRLTNDSTDLWCSWLLYGIAWTKALCDSIGWLRLLLSSHQSVQARKKDLKTFSRAINRSIKGITGTSYYLL